MTDTPTVEQLLHIVFDGPPGPEAGRFVECETPDGRSVSVGEWHERSDGYWELRVPLTQQPRPDASVEGLALAVRFHDTYEQLAPSFGYETRKETRNFDPTTPNGRLMVAVCTEILAALTTREAVVEECAKVADNYAGFHPIAQGIAAEIRALAAKEVE